MITLLLCVAFLDDPKVDVHAPFIRVEVGGGVHVRAPFVHVDVGRQRRVPKPAPKPPVVQEDENEAPIPPKPDFSVSYLGSPVASWGTAEIEVTHRTGASGKVHVRLPEGCISERRSNGDVRIRLYGVRIADIEWRGPTKIVVRYR